MPRFSFSHLDIDRVELGTLTAEVLGWGLRSRTWAWQGDGAGGLQEFPMHYPHTSAPQSGDNLRQNAPCEWGHSPGPAHMRSVLRRELLALSYVTLSKLFDIFELQLLVKMK